jgi:hypothetical protein
MIPTLAASCLAAIALASCASGAAAAFSPSSAPAKRDFGAPIVSSGASGDFHIMRAEQLRGIPAGSDVGVISSVAGGLSLFVEADLEAKGLVARQIDVYGMMSPRERAITDPAEDFAYINDLIGVLAKADGAGKEGAAAAIDKLLPADKIDLENQLAERYLVLYQNLKKMVSALNVDYLVLVGPAYSELSYSMRIYDTTRFDLVYTCLFVGDAKEWRSVIGSPQKNVNLSYYYRSDSEPTAFWELAFSKFAVDRIKIGGSAPAAKP